MSTRPVAPPNADVAVPSPDLLAAEAALLDTVGVPVERGDVRVDLPGVEGGARLHYLTCGEGDPLVLLHGRGNAAAMFAPILRQLAESGRRVYALDLPGWGLSEKPRFTGHTAQDALDLWVAGVHGFLDALDLGAVELLGHSMGGFTALGMALAHPERVRRLVLLDAGGLGRQSQFDVRLYFWLKPERLHRWFGPRMTAYILNRDHRAAQISDDAFFRFNHLIATQADVIPSGGAAFDRWVSITGVHMELRHRLRELQMPVLLAWGDRDQVVPVSSAFAARKHIPYGSMVIFSNAGHSPYLERPDDVARVVSLWLDGHRVPTRV